MAGPNRGHKSRIMTGKQHLAIAAIATIAMVSAACGNQPPSTTPPLTNTAHATVDSQTVDVTVPAAQTVSLTPSPIVFTPPAGVAFPAGGFDLNIYNLPAGGTTTVQVEFATKVDGVRKLIDGEWDLFRYDGDTGVVVADDGMSATIHLRDGGRGDTDGVANGTIADPFAPTEATALTITTDSLPTGTAGSPYTTTLQSAGATGPVTWTVLEGALPTGLTLDPQTGTISGTTAGGSFFRVQATDGTTTVTKLLIIITRSATPPPAGGPAPLSTGEPLPNGTSIGIASHQPALPQLGNWYGRYNADGTLTGRATEFGASYSPYSFLAEWIEPVSAAPLSQIVSNGLVADQYFFGLFSAAGPTGQITLRDLETGAVAKTLDPATYPYTPAAYNMVFFSTNGNYLYTLTGPNQSTGSRALTVYDTATWQALRDPIPVFVSWSGPYSSVGAISPDGSEVLVNSLALVEMDWQSTLRVISLTDPTGASDRTLPIPSECGAMGSWPGIEMAWSVTGRLAFSCGNSLLTMSASDGTDVRVLATTSCPTGGPCTLLRLANNGATVISSLVGSAYSPNGQHLVVNEYASPDGNANNQTTTRVAYLPDAAGATPTYLTTAATGTATRASSWR